MDPLIKWRTDTDEFEPGQWIKGKIGYSTLSSDGRYAAIGIMVEPGQHVVICRPPYFTALEAWIGDLAITGVAFTEDDRIACDPERHPTENARNLCPCERVPNHADNRVIRYSYDHEYVIPNGHIGYDQQDRRVMLAEGKVFALDTDEPRLPYDSNPNRFTSIVAPPWATEW